MESPSHLRTHPLPLRVTLLAALLHEREREITDTLVELLISTAHRIGARAEKKVTEQLVNAFKKVSGKENILFKLAEASLGEPEGTVCEVVYPAVSGGEQALRELVHEFKTRGPVYRRTVQTTLKASYTNHYRRGLVRLLDVLEFRSSNHTHRPVIEALALVARYAAAGNTTYYPLGETVPVHKAMGGDWAEVVYRTDKRGRRRVARMVYEVVAFQALRDQLKCKEIWVAGADKWRNPDEDLPQDFAERREENYRELRKPLDAADFVDELRGQMAIELTLLNEKVPGWSWDPYQDVHDAKVEVMQQFCAVTGRPGSSIKQREEWNSHPVGVWLSSWRTRRDVLSASQEAELEALPGWAWDQRGDQWTSMLQQRADFGATRGHIQPSLTLGDEQEKALARWKRNNKNRLRGRGDDKALRLRALLAQYGETPP
ncbi:hypothetical protein ABZ876_37335 [Streptomyces sp. NPDC046931]|uniref:hypothetical protein n=1 Tax=Streptomyces sp. NPDC046931 TaxID=3154806 RepID=UPI0033FE9700